MQRSYWVLLIDLVVALGFLFQFESAFAKSPRPTHLNHITSTAKPATASVSRQTVKAFVLYDLTGKLPKKIGFLSDGQSLDLASLPASFTIGAITYPAAVGSVTFSLDSGYSYTDTGVPYTISGKQRPVRLNSYSLNPGTYHLTAQTFTRARATGIPGVPTTIQISIVNSAAPPPVNPNAMNIGINLNSPSYWDEDALYSDITNLTSPWWADNSQLTSSQIVPLTLDANNYPQTDAQTLAYMRGYPAGVYHASWEHDANTNVLILPGFESPEVVNRTDTPMDSQPGMISTTMDFKLDAGAAIAIHVHRTQSDNPHIQLQNFHIIAPYTDAQGNVSYNYGIFNPVFLARLQPFSTIRTMGLFNIVDDAQNLKDDSGKDWTDRTLTSRFGRSGRAGMAYEEAIALANQTGKDIWINIPDMATDDYVHQMAALFHQQINSNSKIYLEFSNEVWNWGFGEIKHVMAQADANPLIDGSDEYTRAMQEVAYQTMRIGKIFKDEFADRANQIYPVLAGQMSNVWTLSVGLDFLQRKLGGVTQNISYISGAPYVTAMLSDNAAIDKASQTYYYDTQKYRKSHLDSDKSQADSDLSQLLDLLFTSMHNNNALLLTFMKQAKALSDQYSVPFIAYEGGQGLTSAWSALSHQDEIMPDGSISKDTTVYYEFDPLNMAQSDPRMGDIYKELFGYWRDVFGKNLFCHLGLASVPDTFGYWGLLTDINQTDTVKWNTLMSLISGTE